MPRPYPSRMLDERALVGDGGGMDLAVELGGEPCALRSSLPPSIEEMDMPPAGRFEEYDVRSRAPVKGDAVGGARGAEAGSDDTVEVEGCGGEGCDAEEGH